MSACNAGLLGISVTLVFFRRQVMLERLNRVAGQYESLGDSPHSGEKFTMPGKYIPRAYCR
jgi:hypothetical protein